MIVEEVEGPAYWASYLINGDASGMSDEEIAECDAWQSWLGGPVLSTVDDSENEFAVILVACKWFRGSTLRYLYAPKKSDKGGT